MDYDFRQNLVFDQNPTEWYKYITYWEPFQYKTYAFEEVLPAPALILSFDRRKMDFLYLLKTK